FISLRAWIACILLSQLSNSHAALKIWQLAFPAFAHLEGPVTMALLRFHFVSETVQMLDYLSISIRSLSNNGILNWSNNERYLELKFKSVCNSMK
ncbi:hypothetical protein, partial [Oleiphilus sp. HI0061]|uniref:hypothetical protein n=1 Tax=Oleiphilus sp. HI0061 TaxID=1822239 RepID=UPI000B2D014C